MKRIGECKQCGRCCMAVGFFLDPDNEIAREWADARGLAVDHGCVTIPNRCPHLAADNRCDLPAGQKPDNCKMFPMQPRELLPGCGFSFVEE